jgi:predicted small integral membrane protein
VGSSLIYVAIVAMWAGLLIPMWLRRHEQETEVRSVDRFSSAMRILSRRPAPPPDRRYLVMPQRPAEATAPLADVPRRAVTRRMPAQPARSRPAKARRSGRARLLARRRRLFVGLLGIAFLTFVLALSGVLSWWWQSVVDLAVVAYLVHLRSEAKRARAYERRYGRARAAAGPAAAVAAPAVEAVDVPVRGRAPLRQPVTETIVANGPLVIDEETWEPVPVPLPTYVTASVAERPEPAPIDLSEHEPLFDQEQWQHDDDFAELVDVRDDELAEIVDRRRAVGD